MAGLKMRTDPEIRARLGESALSHLRTQLRAVDCQTCGSRFRRWQKPALAVYAEGERAQASLHHAGCHRPGWHEGRLGPVPEGRHLTWRAGTFVMPSAMTFGLSSEDIPFFLVNPSYESALLQDSDGEGWRVWTVDLFQELGLDRGLEALKSDAPTRALSASIDGEWISITVRAGKVRHHWLDIPLTAETAGLVRSRGSIVVAVTTRVDVYQPLSHFQVEAYMAAGLMAVGVAALSSPKDAARRRRKR
ncbi:hypothetical protein IM697_04685 [Streptomyces ferrugineus]|uniref:Uncharacterized protein n=1 Tax=Streptomyces ferrugineus TaxID=1413221 RepID=A0A7M2SQF4_9ACTN|nr:hypothetical protein [Streptomyces ferrugineus]QOV37723.1 hypothetical protein IM697_04685 [Streptomyces ferrugineus]